LLETPVVIPMHFGTFPPLTGTPDALRKLVTGTQVWDLEPGKTVNW
jgi:L-ascorbate metabolism protein UlaG (beta-lactamase superfamily)